VADLLWHLVANPDSFKAGDELWNLAAHLLWHKITSLPGNLHSNLRIRKGLSKFSTHDHSFLIFSYLFNFIITNRLCSDEGTGLRAANWSLHLLAVNLRHKLLLSTVDDLTLLLRECLANSLFCRIIGEADLLINSLALSNLVRHLNLMECFLTN
jgi:hypothetical protein